MLEAESCAARTCARLTLKQELSALRLTADVRRNADEFSFRPESAVLFKQCSVPGNEFHTKMAKRYCSFCGRDESQCSSLFQGLHGELLCGDCVRLMASELTGAATGGR